MPCSTTWEDQVSWTHGGCSAGALVSYGSASTLKGSGHRLRPYLPIFGRILLWNALPNGKRATFYYVKRWPEHFQADLSAVLSLLAEGKIEARASRNACRWIGRPRRSGSWPRAR